MAAHDSPCQRWKPGGIQVWRRPSDGGFTPARYGVDVLPEAGAKEFVTGLHYSRSYPAARQRYGMFDLTGDAPRLVGAAVLSVPAQKRVLTKVFPDLEPYEESLELGRFVLRDEVAWNGESWFFAECRRLAAATGVRGLVMFSDPVERTRADRTLVMPGHVGVIYQASNAVYTGQATRRTLALLPDGTVFSDRAAQKVRKQEQGHEYAERQLIEFGARPMRTGEKPAAWLAEALAAAGVRKFRHPGNHRYAIRLGTDRRARAAVVIALHPAKYPKKHAGRPGLFGLAA